MKRARPSAVMATLALLMVTSCLWLILRDDHKTNASSTVHSWRTFAGAVMPFWAPDLVNPKRGQYQDLGISLFPHSAASGYTEWPGTYDGLE